MAEPEPPEPPWLSAVVTCMGRLDHLRRTLPALAAEPGVEVVLVDWSCPDRAGAWARVHFPAVRVVEVPGQHHFHKTRALNAGIRAARAPCLAVLDADMRVAPGFSTNVRALLDDPGALLGLDDERLPGFLACWRDAFDRTGGYDERMVGWGYEDDDIRRRLLAQGLTLRRLPPGAIEVLPHGDEERTRYYAEKDRRRSAFFNQALVWEERWVEAWRRPANLPRALALAVAGPALGAVWKSVQYALHLAGRLGIEAALRARGGEAALAREALDLIDAPRAVEVVADDRPDRPVVALPLDPWQFPYFRTRRRWRPWTDGAPRGRIAVRFGPEAAAIGERDRVEVRRFAPGFRATTLDAGVPLAAWVEALAEADLYAGTDEGVAHVARSVGTPAFILATRPAAEHLAASGLDTGAVLCADAGELLERARRFLGLGAPGA